MNVGRGCVLCGWGGDCHLVSLVVVLPRGSGRWSHPRDCAAKQVFCLIFSGVLANSFMPSMREGSLAIPLMFWLGVVAVIGSSAHFMPANWASLESRLQRLLIPGRSGGTIHWSFFA